MFFFGVEKFKRDIGQQRLAINWANLFLALPAVFDLKADILGKHSSLDQRSCNPLFVNDNLLCYMTCLFDLSALHDLSV